MVSSPPQIILASTFEDKYAEISLDFSYLTMQTLFSYIFKVFFMDYFFDYFAK